MADNYIIKLISSKIGSLELPVGTKFPTFADPAFDNNGMQTRTSEIYSLEGIYNLADRDANFKAAYNLLDFVNKAGIVRVVISFGASQLRTLPAGKKGPVLRNCRIFGGPGALATHAHFSLEIHDIKDDDESNKGEIGGLNRSRQDLSSDKKHLQTIFTVTAEGDGAKDLIESFEPKEMVRVSDATVTQNVDGDTVSAVYTINPAQKVDEFLTWVRSIDVTGGGSPITERRVIDHKPILRKGLDAAWRVTDTNTFRTLGKWIDGVRDLKLIFKSMFQDETLSTAEPHFEVEDAAKDIWIMKIKDVYVIDDVKELLTRIDRAARDVPTNGGPFIGPAYKPAPDPKNWDEKDRSKL